MVSKVRFLLLGLPLLLAGCVDIEMSVSSTGKVSQTFIATVSQRAADVLKAAAQNYLGRNWRISVERKGELSVVRVWSTYKPRPEAKPMPGLTVDFRRRNNWFRATYELLIRYNPNELFQTKDEQSLVAERKLTARIFMPGCIVPERSTVAYSDGNMAELNLEPLAKSEIRVVSVGIIWWRLGLLILLIAFVVWVIAPYIPRIAEKLRRPSVKVVQR
ncbi:MAG: hypothetical protein NZ805_11635 [Armatimonadetes bacterium]|nr:hypothetical protein [Armatimonadota bacterium]MDW8027180.1 hypothetical protein [Armatimonadota bacterium]